MLAIAALGPMKFRLPLMQASAQQKQLIQRVASS
jgi:hypothetical protein